MAAFFSVACGNAPPVASTTATPPRTVNSTAQPSPTLYSPPATLPTPSPSTILDDKFGFLIGGAVHRESDAHTMFVLGIGNVSGVVSHDGRQMAYWAASALRAVAIKPNALPRTLLTLTAKGEYSYNIAWSSDNTGIVVGVNGGGGAAPDAPPGYTAIRVIDATGTQLREIARIANANVVPLAWDRAAHLVVAYEPFCCGTINYDTITEEGAVKRTKPDPALFFFQASHDAKFVFGRNLASGSGPFLTTTLLRVWPVDSYDAGTTIRSAGGGPIRAAEWLPGSQAIGVLFDDRLELWSPTGPQRTISLPNLPPLAATNPNASLLFRTNGKTVFISLQTDTSSNAETVAVELESGGSEAVVWGGLWPSPGAAVRLGSSP